MTEPIKDMPGGGPAQMKPESKTAPQPAIDTGGDGKGMTGTISVPDVPDFPSVKLDIEEKPKKPSTTLSDRQADVLSEKPKIQLKEKISGTLGTLIRQKQKEYMVGEDDDFEDTPFMSKEYHAQPRSWWRRAFTRLVGWAVPFGIGVSKPVDLAQNIAIASGSNVVAVAPVLDAAGKVIGHSVHGPATIELAKHAMVGKDIFAQVGTAGEMAKLTVEGVLPAAALSAVAGGLFQLGIDSCRGIFRREKSYGLFIRSMISKGKMESKMAKSIMFGDRPRFDQLERYQEMINDGTFAPSDITPETIKRLAATAIAHDADLRAIKALLPAEANKWSASDLEYFDRVKKNMDTATKLIKEGLPESEWSDFFDDYLPSYMNQRNVANYLKMMGVRAVKSALKWSFVGALGSLFKGLDNFNVVKHFVAKIRGTTVEGVNTAAGFVHETGKTAVSEGINLGKGAIDAGAIAVGLPAPFTPAGS